MIERDSNDAVIATVARSLAHALMDFAYTRKDEDRKRVNELQQQLCAYVQREERET
jgi:hypothetical protein